MKDFFGALFLIIIIVYWFNNSKTPSDAVKNQTTTEIVETTVKADLPPLDISNKKDQALIKRVVIDKTYKAFGKETNWTPPKQRIKSVEVFDEIINIFININENLTNGLIVDGVIYCSWELMKSIFTDSSLKSVSRVRLIGYLPTVNKYGKTELSKVISLDMTREMAQKIVWDKVLDKRAIFDEVEKVWVHYCLRN